MRKIRPMLLNVMEKPFDDPNYLFELKLDGVRAIAYLDNQTTLISRNDNDLTETYKELKSIHINVKIPCILDGEIMGTQFVAFDILQLGEQILVDKPLTERKKLLSENIIETKQLVISRFIIEQGTKLFELVQQQNLEGIIAKRKDSIYRAGVRSNDWVKIKTFCNEDFVILDYKIENDGKIKSLLLENHGWRNFNLSRLTSEKIIKQHGKGKLVCTIQYMHKTKSGNMRQPVFKGLRLD